MSLRVLAQPAPPPELPAGYEVLRQFDRPARWATGSFPLKVYSTDPSRCEILRHSLEQWNQAGLGPLFQEASAREEADLVLDWSGARLPPGRVGAVWWDPEPGHLQVRGITLDPTWRVSDELRKLLLMQELGHALGLGHSTDSRDVMYERVVSRRGQATHSAALTARDRAALLWLYSQGEFVPILARLPVRAAAGASVSPGAGTGAGPGAGDAASSDRAGPPDEPAPLFTPVP